MLTEAQIATILIKVKVKGCGGLRKKLNKAKTDEQAKQLLREYNVENPKFTKLARKANISFEALLRMLKNVR